MKKFENLELDLREIKAGDLVCMRYKLSPSALAIRYFINLRKPKELRSPFNHIAMVVMVEGKPFIAEADGDGFNDLKSAKSRLCKKTISIRRPNFPLKKSEFTTNVINRTYDSPKYDYKGTFWEQAIYQLFGYKKNKSKVEGDKKLYCSEAYARMINLQKPEMYKEYYLVDPQDLYIDDNYTTIFEGKVKK